MTQTTYEVLSDVTVDGLINEDVMQNVFDLSEIPLPFTSRAGDGSHGNRYHSWPQDRLSAPDTSNAVSENLDNQTASGQEDNSLPVFGRVGNHSQISKKTIHVSKRARYADRIAYQDEFARAITRAGKELRRDVEAIALLNQASNADDPGTSVGTTAGLEAWLCDVNELDISIVDATAGNASQIRDYSTGGVDIKGWKDRVGTEIPIQDYSSVTAGGAGTETGMRDVVMQLYKNGFDEAKAFTAMGRPEITRKFSEYFFTSSARVGTLVQQVGDIREPRVANGSATVFKTDFGVLELVPNRLMQVSGDGSPDVDTLFIYDPAYTVISMMQPYTAERLAQDGLMDKWMMFVDWSLRVNNWTAIGAMLGLDNTAAVTQA